ncbi:MAG: hypothetical protein ACOZB1_16445 [Pseudomonadota bacterium]|jgi:hypothetical protein
MLVTPQEIRFDTRADYSQAIDTLLRSTVGSLRVFDLDLKNTGFESAARAAALANFLGQRGGQIQMVLHDPEHLLRCCPRVMSLFTRHGHCFAIRRTPDDLRLLTDCFLLADEDKAVIRLHADHFRGKLLLAKPEDVRPWRQRFAELWDASLPSVAATRLGL